MQPRLESLRVMRKKYTHLIIREVFLSSIQKSSHLRYFIIFLCTPLHISSTISDLIYTFFLAYTSMHHKKVVHNFQHYILFSLFSVYFSSRLTSSFPVVLDQKIPFSPSSPPTYRRFTSIQQRAHRCRYVFSIQLFSSYDFIISVREENQIQHQHFDSLTLVEWIAIVI